MQKTFSTRARSCLRLDFKEGGSTVAAGGISALSSFELEAYSECSLIPLDGGDRLLNGHESWFV